MRIHSIDTIVGEYNIRWEFLHHIKGDKITIYIYAWNQHGNQSTICSMSELIGAAPQFVHVDDMDNSWWIYDRMLPDFLHWLTDLDGEKLESWLDEDQKEGEWS